jgi:predicted MFS family arabinose efflux permease
MDDRIKTRSAAMTRTTSAAKRRQIMTRALALLFVASVGAGSSFYLLVSVVPLYAASEVGAGLATGALMLSTVATELLTPRLVARFGYRRVLAAGLLLLGAPALALPASAGLATILVVCAIRGVGFAITVVVGAAQVALLVPPERRGEGLGLYGVVVGVPSVVSLPLGVWLVGQVGYPPVFVAGALAALAGLVAVRGLPDREPTKPEQPLGVLAGLRTPALVRPALVFATTAMVAGVVITFLPVAAGHAAGSLAAVALLAQSTASTLTRWWAGRHSDRHGTAAGLLVPAVLVAAAGVLALVLVANPVAVVTGMAVFGAGFGVAQNASLALMLQRADASAYGTVSALWNLAYDAAWGVGAAGFGFVVAPVGYPAAFALTACIPLLALTLASRERRRVTGAAVTVASAYLDA